MEFRSLADLSARGAPSLAKGPVCLVLAEDETEIASTVHHHLNAGFATLLLALPPGVPAPPDLPQNVHLVHTQESTPAFAAEVVNAVIPLLKPGTWLGYLYNAEYLFTPFSEHRSVAEALHFCTEERRDSVLCSVIDLYAPDLGRAPSGVDLSEPFMDRTGYYGLARFDGETRLDRQMDLFGGLRWRFEEHVNWSRRRIDRPALFRTAPGLRLREDHRLTDEELNTYACPWHHSMTAAICSFRAAKALAGNPSSRAQIQSFWWHNSERFDWKSQQLLDLGMIEPGQWF